MGVRAAKSPIKTKRDIELLAIRFLDALASLRLYDMWKNDIFEDSRDITARHWKDPRGWHV